MVNHGCVPKMVLEFRTKDKLLSRQAENFHKTSSSSSINAYLNLWLQAKQGDQNVEMIILQNVQIAFERFLLSL